MRNVKLIFIILAGCGYSMDKFNFEYWDSDNDGTIEQEEFNYTMEEAEFIQVWDSNNDQLLTSDEFYRTFFDLWDVNNDHVLNHVEWDHGKKAFLLIEDYDELSFESYDFDNNGVVGLGEFMQRITGLNYHQEWDLDDSGFLDEDEFYEELYRLWDLNNDGKITQEEYEGVHESYYNI